MLPGKNIMAHAREHMQIDSTKLADTMLQQPFLLTVSAVFDKDLTPLKIDIGHRHTPVPAAMPRSGGG
jgi:hypothetical protein